MNQMTFDEGTIDNIVVTHVDGTKRRYRGAGIETLKKQLRASDSIVEVDLLNMNNPAVPRNPNNTNTPIGSNILSASNNNRLNLGLSYTVSDTDPYALARAMKKQTNFE